MPTTEPHGAPLRASRPLPLSRCAWLLAVSAVAVGCGGGDDDDDGVTEGSGWDDFAELDALADTLRECGLLGNGRTGAFTSFRDVEGRCRFECLSELACEQLDQRFCEDDDSIEVACIQACRAEHGFACADESDVLPATWRCDAEPDCADGSDEVDCTYFECADGGQVSLEYVCDWDDDCEDGSDEVGCTNGFRCRDGSMIDPDWACDGDRDCAGGEDESGCAPFCT